MFKFEDDVNRERLEAWLRTEVVAAYDALEADPSRARSVEQVRATLAELFIHHHSKHKRP